MVDDSQYTLINWLNSIFKEINVNLIEKKHCKKNDQYRLFLVMPNVQHGKLLLPIDLAFKHYWRGLDLYSPVFIKLMLKKYGMASFGIFSNYFKIPFPKQSIYLQSKGMITQDLFSYLSNRRQDIDAVHTFAVRIGSKGVGLKLIFQFQDKYGQIVSYIKLGDISNRGKFLLNEVKILEELSKLKTDDLLFPLVLGTKKLKELLAVEIKPIKESKYLPRYSLRKIAVSLAELCNITSKNNNSCFEYNEDEIENLIGETKGIELIKRNLDLVTGKYFPRPLCHRDLTYWHVKFTNDNKLGILDWEYGKQNHNPFQDLFHYIFHSNINNSIKSPVNVYINLFYKNKAVQEAICEYGNAIGVNGADQIFAFYVIYLFDWYSLERSRARKNSDQGLEYLKLIKFLGDNPHYSFKI